MCDGDAEKRLITQALNSNGYSTGVVKRNWHPPAHSPASDPVTTRATVVILYVRHISESIRQILTPLEIQTCFRPHCTLRQTLANLKDRIPLQQWVGVVYRIPCGTCPKVYVGQTCRTLNHWLKEHQRALTSGTWPSLQLQSMRLMSTLSSIGKRPRWWTPTQDTIRDVHSSRGTSGRRPPQWTEMMAAYHRLITPSSTTGTNHTPHTRPHTVLSIFNCIVSSTSSQPLIVLILYTTTSIILSPHSIPTPHV